MIFEDVYLQLQLAWRDWRPSPIRCLARPLRMPKPGGFTITELLVVCGILAALASLLLLAVTRSRSKARNVACVNLLRQIGCGLQMYVQDHENYPPLTDSDG